MSNLEQIPANEAAIIEQLGERLKNKIAHDYANGTMRRDAHPKMHGLVEAEFTVLDNLPEELSVGLFSQPKSYPAWVRFSNAAQTINPDIAKDIRGMAIKLMGVPGEKLLTHQKDAQTHDFLLMSEPAFITQNVADFDAMAQAINEQGLISQAFFMLTHPKILWRVQQSMKKHANPLQIRYFSSTPYLFGERAVKYSVIPHINQQDAIPASPGDNFLRDAMIRQLSNADVIFDFCVQLQADPVQMPVEDPSKVWDEKQSPFRKVATIRIPQQVFATAERDELGENLSFTPWHALPEHRPLGGINRARGAVYELIADFRRQQNQVVMREPTELDP